MKCYVLRALLYSIVLHGKLPSSYISLLATRKSSFYIDKGYRWAEGYQISSTTPTEVMHRFDQTPSVPTRSLAATWRVDQAYQADATVINTADVDRPRFQLSRSKKTTSSGWLRKGDPGASLRPGYKSLATCSKYKLIARLCHEFCEIACKRNIIWARVVCRDYHVSLEASLDCRQF